MAARECLAEPVVDLAIRRFLVGEQTGLGEVPHRVQAMPDFGVWPAQRLVLFTGCLQVLHEDLEIARESIEDQPEG